jgi:hypothetical protein
MLKHLWVIFALVLVGCNTLNSEILETEALNTASIPRTNAQFDLIAQTITAADVNAALDALGAAPGSGTSVNATLSRLRAYKMVSGQSFLTVKGLAIRIPNAPVNRPLTPTTNYPNDYCSSEDYPQQWNWTPVSFADQPQPATSGTPLIKHIRNGIVIAEYDKFGQGSFGSPNMQDDPDPDAGAFHRVGYQNWKNGDIFEVYPAVYQGEDQQPWIGKGFINDTDYSNGIFNTPKNIIIRGMTVNGKRPVIKLNGIGTSNNTLGQSAAYFDSSENIIFENIDIDGNGATYVGKAGIYINGAKNLTLRNLRIHGFKGVDANGIFGTNNNSGLLKLENIELYDNGGANGPEHNIYINRSQIDSGFTVSMRGSWSHDAYYGHLFKSRAQRNILEGNYFMGTKSTNGIQTENYLVDIPEGGTLLLRNNILIKNASGDGSNAMSVTFAMENQNNTASNRILIENNTFVAFSKYYDTQGHPIYPMQFYYPGMVPGSAGFPKFSAIIRNNVFVGYCTYGNAVMDYRGTGALRLTFNQVDQSFRLRAPQVSNNFSTLGSVGYGHMKRFISRATLNRGARD